jgi:hypothetical protein
MPHKCRYVPGRRNSRSLQVSDECAVCVKTEVYRMRSNRLIGDKWFEPHRISHSLWDIAVMNAPITRRDFLGSTPASFRGGPSRRCQPRGAACR